MPGQHQGERVSYNSSCGDFTNRLMHLHLSLFPWILYKTLSSEIRMVMKAFNEGINVIRELGTALTAALAIKVTASQCTSKQW